MLKNIFLFIVSLTISGLITITVYFLLSPSNTEFIKPFFPKTLFSLENAPTQSIVGNVTLISGSVAWQSRISPYSILINSPIKLQQGEEIDTQGNGQTIVSFAKVGIITFSPDTQINFIQTLSSNFVVQQKQGSAVYEKNGDIPMNIRGLDLLINLNSGKSIISVNPKNFQIALSVETGSATVAFNDTGNLTNILTISAGSEYIFNNNTKLGVINKL